ncbi:alpha/beta fold hydrolase [Nocardia arizonensis]|uniref:alpha/beta fold hydrolase n=1 Tax=Nocardia arizonensis TaxID=1141647 RepID=UPI000A75C225|nr:alpha/beta hydrolase [Nocardia arizonensis]
MMNITERSKSAVPGMRRRSVLIDGRIANYRVGGRGPRVLFLHGWGLGGLAYSRPLEQLVRMGLRVYAPSLPGFGGTAALPPAHRTLSDYADWVRRFIETVGVALPISVVGHSFGGGVAIATAHRYPDVAERLVLVNSIGGSAWTDGKGAMRALRERPLWDWGLHLPADLLPGRQLTRVLPVVLRDAVPSLARNPGAVWDAAHIARTTNLTAELADLAERRVPMFVVWSNRDTVIPEATSLSLHVAAGGPDAATVSGGHAWLMDDPRAFGELITNVIQRPTVSPSARTAVGEFPESVGSRAM